MILGEAQIAELRESDMRIAVMSLFMSLASYWKHTRNSDSDLGYMFSLGWLLRTQAHDLGNAIPCMRSAGMRDPRTSDHYFGVMVAIPQGYESDARSLRQITLVDNSNMEDRT